MDTEQADAIYKMIKKMDKREIEKTLFVMLLQNARIVGKMEALCDDLITFDVEEIINTLGPEFRKTHKF